MDNLYCEAILQDVEDSFKTCGIVREKEQVGVQQIQCVDGLRVEKQALRDKVGIMGLGVRGCVGCWVGSVVGLVRDSGPAVLML